MFAKIRDTRNEANKTLRSNSFFIFVILKFIIWSNLIQRNIPEPIKDNSAFFNKRTIFIVYKFITNKRRPFIARLTKEHRLITNCFSSIYKIIQFFPNKFIFFYGRSKKIDLYLHFPTLWFSL